MSLGHGEQVRQERGEAYEVEAGMKQYRANAG